MTGTGLFLPSRAPQRRTYNFPPGARWNAGSQHAQGLEYWWPFQMAGIGTKAYDQIRGENVPPESGSKQPLWIVDPEMGRVASCDFSSDLRFRVTDRPLTIGSAPFTILAWFKTQAVSTDSGIVACIGDNSVGNKYMSMFTSSTNTILNALHRNTGVTFTASTLGITARKWHHGAVTFTPSGSQVVQSCYMDGGNKGTSGDVSNHPFTGGDTIGIGGPPHGTANAGFDGDIADVRFYGRILTDREIADQFKPEERWDLYRQRPLMFPGVDAPGAVSGRVMSSLVGAGGLAGPGGIAGAGGGLAG